MSDVEYTWEGVSADSVSKLARRFSVNKETLRLWLKKGYTCFDDVPKHGGHNSREITWNGKTYPSIRTCAKELHITPSALQIRLEKGQTKDTDVPSIGRPKK